MGTTSLVLALFSAAIAAIAHHTQVQQHRTNPGLETACVARRIGRCSLLYGATFAFRCMNDFVTVASPGYAAFFCDFELLNMCVLLLVCEVLPSFAVLYTLSPAFTVPDAELGEPLVPG